MTRLNRRGFLGGAAAAFGGATLGAAAPFNILPARVHPAVVSSVNGLPYMEKALERLAEGDDTLDVCVWAVNQVENDPEDQSVGYGGLPNEEGIVELDACCMHGPSNTAGSVASLRNIKNPVSVARDVLLHTDHVMLVAEGALRFARSMGYPEENLLTEASRKRWIAWRAARSKTDDWLEPGEKFGTGAPRPTGKRETGTINFDAVNGKGEVSGCTTTSGLAFKVPGRVGDSPIIGAGLYVHGKVGAAGGTGRGEAAITACGAHLIVEEMRRGAHPKDACLEAVKRVVEMNTIPYLLDEKGRTTFQCQFYAVDVKGRVGAASIWPSPYAHGDGDGVRKAQTASLYE
ncbi:MAG: N(4)-(beta-N-acetylglucosaminyl)-L-asparaginase [Planctomycetota bacterium]